MRFNRRREFSSSHSRIQTQGDTGSLGTNQLNAQKIREAPRGPPRPAGQADAFMLFVNGVRRYESATMPLFFPPSLAGRLGLSPCVLSCSFPPCRGRPHLPSENRISQRYNATTLARDVQSSHH